MTVIIYIAVFAAIVAAVGIGGALCESEKFEERAENVKRGAAAFLERAADVVLFPVEAASAIYDSIRK